MHYGSKAYSRACVNLIANSMCKTYRDKDDIEQTKLKQQEHERGRDRGKREQL